MNHFLIKFPSRWFARKTAARRMRSIWASTYPVTRIFSVWMRIRCCNTIRWKKSCVPCSRIPMWSPWAGRCAPATARRSKTAAWCATGCRAGCWPACRCWNTTGRFSPPASCSTNSTATSSSPVRSACSSKARSSPPADMTPPPWARIWSSWSSCMCSAGKTTGATASAMCQMPSAGRRCPSVCATCAGSGGAGTSACSKA